jgi:hypothetical protein
VTTLREILLDARDQIIDARGLADWQFQREVLADLAAGARIALEAAIKACGSAGQNPTGLLVFSETTTYPGLSPDASRDLDDVLFSLSGDQGLTESRLTQLSEFVTRLAAASGVR